MASERGSALVEAAGVALTLILFTGGILSVGYLLFARAWLEYQSEQALYCLAERRAASSCRHALERRVDEVLPWGRARAEAVARDGAWWVEGAWRLDDHALVIRKELSPRIILKRKGSLL